MNQIVFTNWQSIVCAIISYSQKQKQRKVLSLCADNEDLLSLDWTLPSLMEPGGPSTADCSGGIKVAWMKGGLEKKG